MDWDALSLSLRLAAWTTVLLLPLGILVARLLAFRRFAARGLVETLIMVPLLLPPTVLGYYLLSTLGGGTMLGEGYRALTGGSLVFTFEGLVLASIIFNLPFAVQPMQRGFETIPPDVREAAWCSGMTRWRAFWRIELPLAWPGVVSALVLVFAHTLGEFGVVLMMGGNIPGETRTISIAIYDRVQAFDTSAAATMSALLLGFSMAAIWLVYVLGHRSDRRHG